MRSRRVLSATPTFGSCPDWSIKIVIDDRSGGHTSSTSRPHHLASYRHAAREVALHSHFYYLDLGFKPTIFQSQEKQRRHCLLLAWVAFVALRIFARETEIS
ncbi:hypothetical protein NPIL_267331 [Nephila pilipes]|uniref:Uncharacterized protein n=1 Tax=Nephila pilipes TaxID=299642 RepID=A0A8X6MQ00_NEPPI|nr:hypothetical protein NPIL_267331 [Nephila pilipes]